MIKPVIGTQFSFCVSAPNIFTHQMAVALPPDVVWEPSREMMDRAQSLIERQCRTDNGAPLSHSRAEFFVAEGGRILETSSHNFVGARKTSAVSSAAIDDSLHEGIRQCIGERVGLITADMMLRRACAQCGLIPQGIRQRHLQRLFPALEPLLKRYLRRDREVRELMSKIRSLVPADLQSQVSQQITFDIVDEDDIVNARSQAMRMGRENGLGNVKAVKVATVISELARNILLYARAGTIEVRPLQSPKVGITIIATDSGPGIPHLEEVLSGRWRSKTGMGMGIIGCKRLMTDFDIKTIEGVGTTITATML